MTKEELRKEAEEWLSITDNHLNDERTHFLSESEYAEQAYLAGVKAGRPQWHDLWEDKKDLPKNRKEVLLRVKLHDKWNREVTLKGYRDFGDCLGEYEEAWGYCDDVHNIKYDFVDGEEVIAWCEIPTFKE